MQDISKISLVFHWNIFKVESIMESLAFWLPLILLFISALFGTALKRRSRDHCLKKFDGTRVLFVHNSGNWQSGIIHIFAQGIELTYQDELKESFGDVKSLVIHPNEVDKIPFIIRPTPQTDTPSGVVWVNELKNIQKPSFNARIIRNILNFYNMLRDAFGQAAQTIIGAMSKGSSVSKVKNADKRINEMGSGLIELVPNSWEPILEKYRGQHIVTERKSVDGLIKEAGILEDYSSKYLLVRKVLINDKQLDEFESERKENASRFYDVLFSRSTTLIRNTLTNKVE